MRKLVLEIIGKIELSVFDFRLINDIAMNFFVIEVVEVRYVVVNIFY